MKIKYVCRLCGESFIPTNHVYTNAQAADIVGHFVKTNTTFRNYSNTMSINLTEAHRCNDGAIGLADFVGFVEGENVEL